MKREEEKAPIPISSRWGAPKNALDAENWLSAARDHFERVGFDFGASDETSSAQIRF
jgi:hypothetical protein